MFELSLVFVCFFFTYWGGGGEKISLLISLLELCLVFWTITMNLKLKKAKSTLSAKSQFRLLEVGDESN